MSFKISERMKNFFIKISNHSDAKKKTNTTNYSPINIMYHYYYLCLLIGIHFNKTKKCEWNKPPDFTDIKFEEMPQVFKTDLKHIWSAYIGNKLDPKLIKNNDRKQILTFISDKFDISKDFQNMNIETINDFNDYAQYGLDYLYDKFNGEPPVYLEEFLESYVGIFKKK